MEYLSWRMQPQSIRTLGSVPTTVSIIAPYSKPERQQIATECLRRGKLPVLVILSRISNDDTWTGFVSNDWGKTINVDSDERNRKQLTISDQFDCWDLTCPVPLNLGLNLNLFLLLINALRSGILLMPTVNSDSSFPWIHRINRRLHSSWLYRWRQSAWVSYTSYL